MAGFVYKKWSWSERHPWSGWRERYRKNEDEFNRRIKKYQAKKNLPTENPHHINGTQKPKPEPKRESDTESSSEDGDREPKRKRKRTSAGDARKRARREEAEESGSEGGARSQPEEQPMALDDESVEAPRRRRTHVPDLYPDLATLDVSPASSDGDDRPRQKPRPAPKVKSKPRAPPSPAPAPGADSEDFFAPVPPTPTTVAGAPSRPPTTTSGGSVTSSKRSGGAALQDKKKHEFAAAEADPKPKPKPKPKALPKIVENAYGTAFAGARRPWVVDSDEEDEAPKKEWPPVRSRSAKQQQQQPKPKPKPRAQSVQSGGDASEMEVEAAVSEQRVDLGRAKEVKKKKERDTKSEAEDVKDVPGAPPARRVPQQVNAVASSSRVQVMPSARLRRAHSPSPPPPAKAAPVPVQKVTQQRQQRQQRSQTPLLVPASPRHLTPSPRAPPSGHHTQRSPSPLDWGSPVVGEGADAQKYPWMDVDASSPIAVAAGSPLVTQDARSERRSVDGSSPPYRGHKAAPVLPRLSLTKGRIDGQSMNGSVIQRNRDRDHASMGSVDQGRTPRRPRSRSRAPSPRTDAHMSHPYRLASPPHASLAGARRYPMQRSQSGTPLPRKATRMPAGVKPVSAPDNGGVGRRHSFPVAAASNAELPHIDFETRRITAPLTLPSSSTRAPLQLRSRHSMPAAPPPARQIVPRRHGSLFPPRTPAAVSTPRSAPTASRSTHASGSASTGGAPDEALAAMAANHRFDAAVVRNVYVATGDLAETDRSAEAAGVALLRELGRGGDEEEVRTHRRDHSGATTVTTATEVGRSPPSAPGSSSRRKQEFRPQPLARGVLVDSRAGELARLEKKGNQEERRRASGSRSGGRSTSTRGPAHGAHGAVVDVPQFEAFAAGNVDRDVSLGMLRAADVAAFMLDGSIPGRYR
ncbi:hypothetical protein B0H11DRAFT_2031613 [Mycena galericulata]|nr:hypothetical protein B0H11DRAFT_2031613 [Mycena galericulata]